MKTRKLWQRIADIADSIEDIDVMLDQIKEREAVLICEGVAPDRVKEMAENEIIRRLGSCTYDLII